jgi:hypothetical protein
MIRFLFLISIAVTFCIATASAIKPDDNEDLGNIQPYILENRINETLRNLSILMQAYDPYMIKEVSYKIGSDNLRGEMSAKNIYLSGFSGFSATDLKNKVTIFPPGVKSTFKVKFDELQLIVPDYFFDGMAVFVPFYGKGFVNLIVREIHGGAFAQILTTTSGLRLKRLDIQLNISQTNLTVSGLLNNEPLSQIVSTSTTECFAEFVNLYNDRLGKLLGARLVDPINKILHPPKATDELDDSEVTEDEYDGDSLEDSSDLNEDGSFDLGPYNIKIKIVT